MLRNLVRNMANIIHLRFTIIRNNLSGKSCPVGYEKSLKSLFVLKVELIFGHRLIYYLRSCILACEPSKSYTWSAIARENLGWFCPVGYVFKFYLFWLIFQILNNIFNPKKHGNKKLFKYIFIQEKNIFNFLNFFLTKKWGWKPNFFIKK